MNDNETDVEEIIKFLNQPDKKKKSHTVLARLIRLMFYASFRNKGKFLFAIIFPILFITINCLQGQVFKNLSPPVKPAAFEKIFTAFSKIFAVDCTNKFWILGKDDKTWLAAKRTDSIENWVLPYWNKDRTKIIDSTTSKNYFPIKGDLFTLRSKMYLLNYRGIFESGDTGKTWQGILKNQMCMGDISCSTGLDTTILICSHSAGESDGIYRINLSPPECKLLNPDFLPEVLFKTGKIYLAFIPFAYNHSSGMGKENGVRKFYYKHAAIWRSEDGGTNWEKVFESNSTEGISKFTERNNTIYSFSGLRLQSADRGKTWVETKTDSLSDDLKSYLLASGFEYMTNLSVTVKSHKGTKTYSISDGKVIITKEK